MLVGVSSDPLDLDRVVATAVGWLLILEYWILFTWWKPFIMSGWINCLVIASALALAVLLLYIDYMVVEKFKDYLDGKR